LQRLAPENPERHGERSRLSFTILSLTIDMWYLYVSGGNADDECPQEILDAWNNWIQVRGWNDPPRSGPVGLTGDLAFKLPRTGDFTRDVARMQPPGRGSAPEGRRRSVNLSFPIPWGQV
jgi:hypothetical protein